VRYVAHLLQSPTRPLGWYVVDLGKSSAAAIVCVGGRHPDEDAAHVEARLLEVMPS